MEEGAMLRPYALRCTAAVVLGALVLAACDAAADAADPAADGIADARWLSTEEMLAALRATGLGVHDEALFGPDSGPGSIPQACDAWSFYDSADRQRGGFSVLYRCRDAVVLGLYVSPFADPSTAWHTRVLHDDAVGLEMHPSIGAKQFEEYASALEGMLADEAHEE